MYVDIDESAEMLYLAENKEEGVSFKEIRAFQSFGLPYNFEREMEVEVLRTEILRCIWLYICMYISKHKVKTLEQICIDEISYSLPFKVQVNRLHLSLPKKWYDDLFYRIDNRHEMYYEEDFQMYLPCRFSEFI